MECVYTASTNQDAMAIKLLLESNGIPASISNKGFARLYHFIPNTLAVFVYLDEQYEDAIKLIENPDHVVTNPVDIDAFYAALESEPMQNEIHNAMNRLILGMFVFGLVCAFLLYLLAR